MRTLVGDFETFFGDDYTLRKMTPIEYVLDARFEALGCAFCWGGDGAPFWVDGPRLPAFFLTIPWDDVSFVSHNALFDALILSVRYGVSAKLWIDTIALARALTYHAAGANSLDRVARYLGFPPKGTALHKMRGYRFKEFKADTVLYAEGVEYAKHDADLCRRIFYRLASEVPANEWHVMDMLVRCVTEPQFVLDRDLLSIHLQNVLRHKAELLARVNVGSDVLQSNDKLAEALLALGVEPPRKISLKTKKETWAFAKTDEAFADLLDDPDEDVQTLVAARFGIKSTQEETRTKRLLAIADLRWADGQRWMPVPLKYSGPHTHRLSGDWSLNLQNLSRPSPFNPEKGLLRKSLRAPPGYVVVVGDESQVECRVDGWLAKQQDLCDQFERGEDVYSIFAGKVVGHEVTKKNKPERFLGKTATLGLGFGMGWLKFQLTVRTKSRLDLGQLIALSDADSQHIVTLYRTINFMIVRLWSHCENLLPSIQAGVMTELGVVFTRKDEIVGPNGLRLRYRNLRKEMRPAYGTDKLKPTWVYDWGRETKTLFGGKVCENIVQFLARIVVMDAAVRIRKTTGFAFAHQGHDELSYVVPKSEGEGMKQVLTEELSRRPSWAPGLPLACEVGIGECYGEAK